MSGPGVAPSAAAVPLQGAAPAVVVAYPANYWEDAALALGLNSVDQNGAKRYKNKSANAPGDYVTQLQRDLITLGYLKAKADDGLYGGPTKRAVARFQRAAARPWRMPSGAGKQQDAAPGELFQGSESGDCDQATALELRKWIDKQWKLPLNRFPFRALQVPGGGQLRDDVAKLWEEAAAAISAKGGSIDGPYGNTRRQLSTQGTVGSSSSSYHYTGRAIDLNQGKREYVYAKEANGSDAAKPFWRIYCKTTDQSGAQGTFFAKGAVKCWRYANSATGGAEYDIPEGYYLDLTAELAALKFERIHAHAGWETSQKKQEWWHFQYAEEKEKTFLDECELAGISEDQLRKAGWTNDSDLDHAAG